MMNRQQKIEKVKELKSLINSHKSIGIIDMHKLPATLVLKVKKDLTGKVKVRMSKKNVIMRALGESGRNNLEEMKNKVPDSSALIFSNENPFELFRRVKATKSRAAAKAGEIVDKDIIVPRGPTKIPPGPAITTLQKVNIKTRVESGKLTVLNDTVALKAGETVTPDLVAALNLLGIVPIEQSIKISSVWEDGIIFGGDVLDINTEEFAKEVAMCISRCINLSLNSGFIVKESATVAVQKAFMEARLIALEANYITSDNAADMIVKAVREAHALGSAMPAQTQESQPVV